MKFKFSYLLLLICLSLNATEKNNISYDKECFNDLNCFKAFLTKVRVLLRTEESDDIHYLPTQKKANKIWQEWKTCDTFGWHREVQNFNACFSVSSYFKLIGLLAPDSLQDGVKALNSVVEDIDKNILNSHVAIEEWTEEDINIEIKYITYQSDFNVVGRKLKWYEQFHLYNIKKCQSSSGLHKDCDHTLHLFKHLKKRIEEKFKCSEEMSAPQSRLSTAEIKIREDKREACNFWWKLHRTNTNIILQQEMMKLRESIEKEE